MIEGIQTLIALLETGTVSKAAVRLRITQSAATKRLKALEEIMGKSLIEPDGRRVRLTEAGQRVVQEGRHLMAGFRSLIDEIGERTEAKTIRLAVSDSIMLSWGASLLKQVQEKTKLALEIHSHRSLTIHELLESGVYDLGLCTEPPSGKSLSFVPVALESIVMVGNGFRAKSKAEAKFLTIEKSSATWKSIERQMEKVGMESFTRVESFPAVLQMCKHGFGNALVPELMAKSYSVPASAMTKLRPDVKRRIGFVARKTTLKQVSIDRLIKEVSLKVEKLF